MPSSGRALGFREIVYELRATGDAPPTQLPLQLTRDLANVSVETRFAHLDDAGMVWRILHVRGPRAALDEAVRRFHGFRPAYLREKRILAKTHAGAMLFYRYRAPRRGPGASSNTLLAFELLGRDLLITDETRGDALTIRILCREQPGIRRFLKAVEEASHPHLRFRLRYLGPARSVGEPVLTEPQRAALGAAMELGYWESPRRVGLREIGRRLGISASAAGYRLRQAEGALARAHLRTG